VDEIDQLSRRQDAGAPNLAELQALPTQSSAPEEPAFIDRRRYRRILVFFAGIIGHIILIDLLLGRVPLLRRWPQRTRPDRLRRMSRRFRELAVEMGGVMIKLGQFLSARVDVLPLEVTEELAGLQDEVAPVSESAIFDVLEAELGDWRVHFAAFDTEPLAAASLGQVHAARLQTAGASTNGQEPPQGAAVVVKVQRPGIEGLVRTDLAALRVVSRWVMRYRPIRRRADVPALLDEFAVTLWEELDYHLEASNAERFHLMFAHQENIRIPAVYWQHSTRCVLTLERVDGIKINDIEALKNAGIDPRRVADRLLDAYFHQIFLEGFFHADPHPGNLFIKPLPIEPADAETETETDEGSRPFSLIYVDFGMTGRIGEALSANLQKVLVSVANQDAHTLTQAYVDMGFLLPGADLERIEEAQRVLLERIWGRNLLEMARPDPQEVRELSYEFRDILFALPFQIPQDFVYLGRCMGIISGLASALDENINPWYHFEKYALEVAQSQQARTAAAEQILAELRGLATLPGRARRLMEAAETGRLKIRTLPDPATTRRLERLEKKVNQLNWVLVVTALLVSGTVLYVSGELLLGIAFWSGAGLLALLSLLRSG
jgi:predicted unusual protein kinase regulating ubiquinone biosynthesis (AarF/ABC1/UbiB family)